ncbi:hypothetical protein F2Q68_00000577 [Brassica cretica]|uniref:Uncharacterized protein n=1 Tax=Brassica cretica TaxID=69181 RepID=A0A8S9JAD7_BRACR|nr:hypothetical protein F2Q68_00000577 [Brassica cretica]
MSEEVLGAASRSDGNHISVVASEYSPELILNPAIGRKGLTIRKEGKFLFR